MSYKRLTPCIFIDHGKAVKWFDNDTVLSEDVVTLAKQYCDRGADELIVFDLSVSDEEHDEAIDLIKRHSHDRRRQYPESGGCEEDSVRRSQACDPEFFKGAFH